MRIAVVDDLKEDAQRIAQYLDKYQLENEIMLHTTIFHSSIDFLEEYSGEYDIIFLDIDMPGCNGLEVAREIRAKDATVGIIFVTSLAQYAIEGYEVNAIDFIVKPVGYYNFSIKLKKAFSFHKSHKEQDLLISNKEGIVRLATSDILYIEKERDYLVFHTSKENIKERGSIKGVKEKIQDMSFSEATSGCIVNLSHVSSIKKDIVILMTGAELPISRRMKKAFIQDYVEYLGGM